MRCAWNCDRKLKLPISADDARRIINEMLARLKRSHFQLLPSVATADDAVTGDAIVPIDVRVAAGPLAGWPEGPLLIVTRVDAAAARSGLTAGDVVSQTDGFTLRARSPRSPPSKIRGRAVSGCGRRPPARCTAWRARTP